MSNITPPPDQAQPLTAAALRARLLSSTPPPVATASTAEPAVAEEEATEQPQSWQAGSAQELLARLRMPGKSGAVPLPTARPTAAVPVATDPVPVRRLPTPRPPAPNGRADPSSAIAGALNQLANYADGGSGRYYDDSPHGEIQRLKNENKELRTLLEEMKHLLQEASESEQQLVTKEKEFEAALAAKDAQIEELSTHLGAIEEQIAKGELAPPPPVPKTRTELEEWADELEKENAQLQQQRKRLDDDRRQLQEDEEGLETQMREMEVSMARERALIARQETELRRLNAEIQHELEMMQRGDANLRTQMEKFQRRAQEITNKPTGGSGTNRR